MMLGEIRDYLQQRGSASLTDVAIHFDITVDTAQFGLNYWLRKGKVREQAASCGASGCGGNSCGGTKTATHYAWVKRDVPLHWFPLKP